MFDIKTVFECAIDAATSEKTFIVDGQHNNSVKGIEADDLPFGCNFLIHRDGVEILKGQIRDIPATHGGPYHYFNGLADDMKDSSQYPTFLRADCLQNNDKISLIHTL